VELEQSFMVFIIKESDLEKLFMGTRKDHKRNSIELESSLVSPVMENLLQGSDE
jgi:hypothetical protein